MFKSDIHFREALQLTMFFFAICHGHKLMHSVSLDRVFTSTSLPTGLCTTKTNVHTDANVV